MGSASALARYLDVHPSELGTWINFGDVPSPLRVAEGFRRKKLGGAKDWEQIEIKLLVLTGHTFDEIFPAEIRGEKFLKQQKRIDAVVDMPIEWLMAAGVVPLLPPAPDDILFREDKSVAIEEALQTLTPRETKILKMRFGLPPYDHEYTLTEVGADEHVTGNRIREIEAKALRRLRHPSRSRSLKPFVGVETLQPEYVLAPLTGEAELIEANKRAAAAKREAEIAEWLKQQKTAKSGASGEFTDALALLKTLETT